MTCLEHPCEGGGSPLRDTERRGRGYLGSREHPNAGRVRGLGLLRGISTDPVPAAAGRLEE